MKVVALKKSAAEKKDAKNTISDGPYGDEEGVSVHMSHDHLKKMGIDGNMTPGRKVRFRGHGHVQSAEKDGHARLMLTHAGMEHGEPDADDRKDRHDDIEKAYKASESKRER